jgi:hypothetical protein
LLAHEFGGVYATYWASLYPDEIKGIVYLDGTVISEEAEIVDYKPSREDKIDSILCRFGFQRILYHNYYNFSVKALNAQEAECSRALNTHSIKTSAQLSELSLIKENFETVLKEFKSNDIPKLYLSASNAFRTENDVENYYEYKNQQNKELGKEMLYDLTQDEEVVAKHFQEFIENSTKKYEEETKPFVETLGNCKLARIPGDVKIYEQKPEGLTDALIDFVWYLSGDEDRIKELYEGSKLVDWEHFQEELEKAEEESQTEIEK